MISKLKTFFNPYTLSLVALLLFHTIFNIVWQRVNVAPPTWDGAGHLTLAYIFADRIRNFFIGDASILSLIKVSAYYPPLVQFVGGVVLLFFGRNYEYALLVETAFLIISIVYLYKSIRHFFPEKPALALLASIMYSFFPQVWEQSRQFHLDVPLCALVLASFYHLSRSKSLTDVKHSLLFFLFFSFAQLTKWYGFVFLAVPFLYEAVVKTIKSRDWSNRTRFINLLLGAVIVLVIAVPWYVVNLKSILANVAVSSTADFGDPQIVLSYESIFHYLKLMTSHQLGVFSVMLFFVALYTLYRDKIAFRKYVLLMFLFPYLTFTVIQNKDMRYILPLTPVVAFLVSYLLTQLGSKTWIKIKASFFCVYLISLFLFFSLNQTIPLTGTSKIFATGIAGPYMQSWVYEPINSSFNPNDYKVDKIVQKTQAVADRMGISANHFKVLTLSDNRYYSVSDFDLFVLQNRFYNMSIVTPFYQLNPFTPDELRKYLSEVSLALIPESPGPSGLRNIEALNQLISYFNSEQNIDFIPVETFSIPDGNKIVLYERTNFDSFINTEVSEDSVKVNVSTLLLLDKEKLGTQSFKVFLYDEQNTEKVVDIAGPNGQQRISLEGVNRFRIELPKNQIDPKEIRGWFYKDGGVFERDPEYFKKVVASGNEIAYQNSIIRPRNEIIGFAFAPKVVVAQEGGKIKFILMDLNERVFVAYAVTGWQWNNFWLSSGNKEVEVPLEGLIQIEVTQRNQLIRGFGSNWDYFTCYGGSAVCFYPLF